jgi:hypothetical protein
MVYQLLLTVQARHHHWHRQARLGLLQHLQPQCSHMSLGQWLPATHHQPLQKWQVKAAALRLDCSKSTMQQGWLMGTVALLAHLVHSPQQL